MDGVSGKFYTLLQFSLSAFRRHLTQLEPKNGNAQYVLCSRLKVIDQVRDDVEPHENFMRGWEDYKVGFGDFDREFWLGE